MDGHATASVQGYRAGLSGSRPKRSLMPMDTMPPALNLAFCTALLLAGDMKTAEAAVMHGIEACEDLPPRGLLIEAVRSAIQRRTTSADGPYELECLPRDLQRLFMLQPLPRHCFVLRMLVGVSPELCAQLLDISIPEFEGALHGGFIELLLLCSPKG